MVSDVARVLLLCPSVVARVAAVRIEASWENREQVRCVARLTRALTPDEAKRVRALGGFEPSTDRVSYSCRHEETEAYGKLLEGALARAATPARSLRGRVITFPLPR